MSELASVKGPAPQSVAAPLLRRPLVLLARRAWHQDRTKVGGALVCLLVGVALIGPIVAPHAPTEFAAAPFAPPSAAAPLGADNLGRDVLSRFLWGGRSVLGLSLAATAIGLVLGALIGLVAAYSRSVLDDILMRGMDVILSFPSIVLALVAVATVGPRCGCSSSPSASPRRRGSPVSRAAPRSRSWSGTSSRQPRRWARHAARSCSARSCPTS